MGWLVRDEGFAGLPEKDQPTGGDYDREKTETVTPCFECGQVLVRAGAPRPVCTKCYYELLSGERQPKPVRG